MSTLNAAKPKTSKATGDSSRTAKSHHAKSNIEVTQCVYAKEDHNVIMRELPIKIRYRTQGNTPFQLFGIASNREVSVRENMYAV